MKPPINIYSGSADSLGAALTNPTVLSRRKRRIKCDYALEFERIKYPDAEAAYQALKGRTEEGDERLQLMTDIIVAKLQQHPKLIEAIALRGGVAWLETCEHTVGAKNSYWEGIGRNSPFIICLIAAYSLLLSCNAVATLGCITVGSMRNLSQSSLNRNFYPAGFAPKLGFINIVCDRTSVLGNPFDMQGDEQKRDTVCDAFRQWLWQNIKLASTSSNAVVDPTEWKLPVAKTWYKPTSTQVWEELNKITNLVRAGTNVRLLCWCKQTNKNVRCHADTIKACIEWMINKS